MRRKPPTKLNEQERLVRSRLTKLVHDAEMIRGSIIQMKRSCGQKACHCQKGQKHVSPYLGITTRRKTQMIFVAKDWEQRVTQWVNNYKETKELLEELSVMYQERLVQRRS